MDILHDVLHKAKVAISIIMGKKKGKKIVQRCLNSVSGALLETAVGSWVMDVVSKVGNGVVVVVWPSDRKCEVGEGEFGPKNRTEHDGSVLGVPRETAVGGNVGR